jgi:hypothetical protein
LALGRQLDQGVGVGQAQGFFASLVDDRHMMSLLHDSPRGSFFFLSIFYNSSFINANRSVKRSITVLPTATAAKYKRKKI